jgi:hypothetical protein
MSPHHLPPVGRKSNRHVSVESHGKDVAVVVVRMLTDEVDPPWRDGDKGGSRVAIHIVKSMPCGLD